MTNMITDYNLVSRAAAYFKGIPATELTSDHTPSILQYDIRRKFITRYFARQANLTSSSDIVEITKQRFLKLKTISLFVVVDLEWKIAGELEDFYVGDLRQRTGVLTANRLSLEYTESLLPGISKKLVDLKQFYIGE